MALDDDVDTVEGEENLGTDLDDRERSLQATGAIEVVSAPIQMRCGDVSARAAGLMEVTPKPKAQLPNGSNKRIDSIGIAPLQIISQASFVFCWRISKSEFGFERALFLQKWLHMLKH